ncbi:trypsin [Orussus abietinus]|uniref:trypsin n=1 Tax=Orussus abietinus TaxID=222816 RepID=UPI0006262BEB|nr:trypsin [Orussus abietinus]
MTTRLFVLATLVTLARSDRPYGGFEMPIFGGTKIVGGVEAGQGQFPHQVSLQWGIADSLSKHFCGGSIIDSQWVLTAGHCIKAVPSYGSFLVKAGKHVITRKEGTEQSVRVAKSFVHESYAGGVAPYDIALVKLRTPLTLNERVATIGLPKPGSIPSGNVILSGWGSISSSSSAIMPSSLQTAELPVVDIPKCRRALNILIGSSPLHETNVCTGSLKGSQSACSGDSGGPLILKNEVIGVVSWGIFPCGTGGAPSVYVRVSAFIDWIESIIANN